LRDIVRSIIKQIKKYGVDIPLFTTLLRNKTSTENTKYIIDSEFHFIFLNAILFSKNVAYIKITINAKSPKRPVFNMISIIPFSI